VFFNCEEFDTFPVSFDRFSEDVETCGFSWSRRGASAKENASEVCEREGLEK
jgi:hypothetical protein